MRAYPSRFGADYLVAGRSTDRMNGCIAGSATSMTERGATNFSVGTS